MELKNIVPTFLLLTVLGQFPSYVKPSNDLHKCCPLDERLIFTRNGFNCTDDNDAFNTTDWWWLPNDVINNETRAVLNDGKISYGIQPECDFTSMDILRFDLSDNFAEFNFHVRGGEVRLDVLKESTFHEPEVGRDDSFPPGSYCADVTVRGVHVVLVCPCGDVACVRKCCYDGSVFNQTEGGCVDVEGNELNGGDFFDWVPKVDKYKEYYRLAGTVPKCDKFTSHVVTTSLNGSRLLLAEDGSLKDLDSGEIFRKDAYCGAHNAANEEMLILCLKTNSQAAIEQIVYGVLFLVGAMCLLATVIVTAILPEMRRNVHGKMALAHNFMLFVGYLMTGISQLRGSTMSRSSCEVMSLVIQFTILAAFFWLNVMCIDISWTFSGIRPMKGTHHEIDEKKFIFYSVYAWGSTALISAATLIVEFSPGIDRFKPNFGSQMCFFNDRGAELLFFFGPMALLLAANLLLFIYIAFKIPNMNQQTTKNSKNKHKLVLYVKLFCLMGVTWVFEVISWAVGGPKYLWYFTDVINLLRAVFIFVIFCCKRRVYVLLREKILRALGKEVPDRNPSVHSTKTYYSNESGGKTISTSNIPAQADRSLATNTRLPNQYDKSRRTEAFEMK